jgi:hypothetical protein
VGEAKRRGTFEERRAMAEKRERVLRTGRRPGKASLLVALLGLAGWKQRGRKW